MCYFKRIGEITNMNEVQTVITRTISRQREQFNYEFIVESIKNELSQLGVEEFVINSFRVNNMILSILDQMAESGDIYSFNNEYIPIRKDNAIRRVMYAYA